jgi:DNA-binding transcriptional LysR family regulator
VRLRFVPKSDRDSAPLREGSVDLETGVLASTMGPEIRTLGLFRDRHVGVVRAGHRLCKGRMTPARYAAGDHVLFSRRGGDTGPIDDALESLGLRRNIVAIVGGFCAPLALARRGDLVASVPERHTQALRDGMHTFPLPVPVEAITVSMFWHPRLDADIAHRWLRQCVRDVCSERMQTGSPSKGRKKQVDVRTSGKP